MIYQMAVKDRFLGSTVLGGGDNFCCKNESYAAAKNGTMNESLITRGISPLHRHRVPYYGTHIYNGTG